jgi:hypothetical protein
MAVAETYKIIKNIVSQTIDKSWGRLSNSSDTILLVNLIPFLGVTEFQEPSYTFDTDIIYSKHQTEPQAVVKKQKTVDEGSITILESTLYKMRASGFVMGNPISIARLVIGKLSLQDMREIKVFSKVIPVSEDRPALNSELMMYTVDVGLIFTQEPFVIPIPI